MLIDPIKTYTYKDYLTYDENKRIEIIDGKIINMNPAPSRIHQKIILKLSTQIENYITSNNGSCEVYPAPFDVILKNIKMASLHTTHHSFFCKHPSKSQNISS